MKTNKLKKGCFRLNHSDRIFTGYYFEGDYWNGWSCPYFTKEEALRIVAFYQSEMKDPYNFPNFQLWGYDSKKDEFHYRDCSYEPVEPNTVWECLTIEGKKLYPIGVFFCWERKRVNGEWR